MKIKIAKCCSLCENFHHSQMGNGYSVDGYCMSSKVEKVRSFEICRKFAFDKNKVEKLGLKVD